MEKEWIPCCITALICMSFIIVACRYFNHKLKLLNAKLKHEQSMKEKEWECKMQWEEKISYNMGLSKEKEMQIEEKRRTEKMNFLHLHLSNEAENKLSEEDFIEELGKASKVYDIIMKYIN